MLGAKQIQQTVASGHALTPKGGQNLSASPNLQRHIEEAMTSRQIDSQQTRSIPDLSWDDRSVARLSASRQIRLAKTTRYTRGMPGAT